MTFKDYIQGKRTGKAANQLERKAMDDPFLQDAIDGYDSVEGDHARTIHELENLVGKKGINHQLFVRRIIVWSAVAILGLVIGISILLRPVSNEQPIANMQKTTTDSTFADTTKTTQPALAQNITPVKVRKHIKKTIRPVAVSDHRVNTEVSDMVVIDTADILTNDVNSSAFVTAMKPTDTVIPGNTTPILDVATQVNGKQTIRGIVTDEKGLPIIGVSVRLKDNKYISTTTDLEGRFLLSGRNLIGNEIEASYLGYNTAIVQVGTEPSIIKLHENNLALSETVVVGYGTTNKSKLRASNANQELQGTLAGVSVKSPYFGEKEFKKFLDFALPDSICGTNKMSLTAKFKINEKGKPQNIKIVYSTCGELEKEFMNLIHLSPAWTEKNKSVVLKYNK